MKDSPFRLPMRRTPVRDRARRGVDRDLLPVLAICWMISVVRVVGAFVRHETFGAEATLALIAVAIVPCSVLLGRRRKPD